jgi:hypothetical protein
VMILLGIALGLAILAALVIGLRLIPAAAG